MKKISLICSDIDGTLTKHCHWLKDKFSELTLHSIKEYSDTNSSLVLCTGRNLPRTQKMADFLEKQCGKKFIPYLICLNGCLIYDNVNKKVIEENVFDYTATMEMWNFATRRKLEIFIVDNECNLHIKNTPFSLLVAYTWFSKYKKNIVENDVIPNKIQKIMIVLKKPESYRLKAIIEEKFPHFYVACSGKYFLEIIDKNINKLFALEKVAEILNIELSDICCMGNEGNDVSMLENAGYSVAMDFHKNQHINYDPHKIKFFTTNEKGNGFFYAFQHLKRLKYI